jgi:hypothetical protein
MNSPGQASSSQSVIRLRRMARNPDRHKSAANTIMAHSESVGTGGMAALVTKTATAGAVLLPLLVWSAPTAIVLV